VAPDQTAPVVINIRLADVYQMEPGIESMGRSITGTSRDHRAPFGGSWRPSDHGS